MAEKLTRAQMLALSPHALREYVAQGGDWTDGAVAVRRPPQQRPAELAVDDISPDAPMKLVSVRLPLTLVVALDELAGNDKDGRSGLIRQGAEQIVAQHRKAS